MAVGILRYEVDGQYFDVKDDTCCCGRCKIDQVHRYEMGHPGVHVEGDCLFAEAEQIRRRTNYCMYTTHFFGITECCCIPIAQLDIRQIP